MKTITLAYFGTPDFSAKFLETIVKDKSINQSVKIHVVVTQPDKPVGRDQVMTPSPVKFMAQKLQIPVYDQLDLNCQPALSHCEYALVFAYGFKTLIPSQILSSTQKKFKGTNSGFMNIHPSLLPKYRGASPIAYPILFGDTETGVTFFVMDEKMDHGPVFSQEKIKIPNDILRPQMEHMLMDLSLKMFKKLLMKDFELLKLVPQNNKKASHAKFMTKNEGYVPLKLLLKVLENNSITINELPEIYQQFLSKNPPYLKNLQLKMNNPAELIFNMFRGLFPWPGIWTKIQINNQEKRLKITNLQYRNTQLHIKRVQLEGKKEVDFSTFNQAYPIFENDC